MRLLVARHGNTFAPGEVIRRVGSRTDIPLVEKGREQAKALGQHFKNRYGSINAIYCGDLRRLRETAEIIAGCSEKFPPPTVDSRFNELDYGKYDGLTEEEFTRLVGDQALRLWDSCAVPPRDWNVDVDSIINIWKQFGGELCRGTSGDTVVVVTSNGTARFAPHLSGEFEKFRTEYGLKLATGAFGEFEYRNDKWHVIGWNIKPEAGQL